MKLNGKIFRTVNTIRIVVIMVIFTFVLGGVSFLMLSNVDFSFKKVSAEITNIDAVNVLTYVTYEVDGVQYNSTVGSYSDAWKVGQEINLYYNPEFPTDIKDFNIVPAVIVGVIAIVCLIAAIIAIVINVKRNKVMDEMDKQFEAEGKEVSEGFTNIENQMNEADFAHYYFKMDNHFNQGHILEDDQMRLIYEAKFVNFRLFGPSDCNFINHITGKAYLHKIGKTTTVNDNSITCQSSFKFDGVNSLDYIHQQGLKIKTDMGINMLNPKYVIYYKGEVIAKLETTGVNLHENMPKKGGFLGNIGYRGFYRMDVNPEYLDQAFLCTVIIARSQNVAFD